MKWEYQMSESILGYGSALDYFVPIPNLPVALKWAYFLATLLPAPQSILSSPLRDSLCEPSYKHRDQ
jgi:hypothetical protein